MDPYPDDVNDAYTQANAKTTLLGVRVADDKIRNLLQEMKNHCTSAFLQASTLEHADFFMDAANEDFTLFNKRIGEVLREMDKFDLTAHM